MAQSVELTLDSAAEAALVTQWERLAAAGLARPKRPEPHGHHLPHVTLYAADAIPEAAEPVLPEIVAGINLSRFESGKFTTLALGNDLPLTAVRNVREDRQKALWIAGLTLDDVKFVGRHIGVGLHALVRELCLFDQY